LEPLWESTHLSLYCHFEAALRPLAPDSAVRWIADKKVVKRPLTCGLLASYISIASEIPTSVPFHFLFKRAQQDSIEGCEA
jgi:hypothetical protein